MTEERVVDPVTGGVKGRKAARFELLPGDALDAIAQHFAKGSRKYEDRNWERGYAWSLSYGAMQRHLWAWWQGEDIDEESGSSHVVSAAWHALALVTFELRGLGTDDRPVVETCPVRTGFTDSHAGALRAQLDAALAGSEPAGLDTWPSAQDLWDEVGGKETGPMGHDYELYRLRCGAQS